MQKPNSTLPQLRDPFQSLFQHLFRDALPEFYGQAEDRTAPRTNIAETATAYELSVELPGFEEKDIRVHMHDNVLTVTAERRQETESKDKRWHRVEHRYGTYSRSISLPNDTDQKAIDAHYKNGVLTITVPKQPETQPTRINVRS